MLIHPRGKNRPYHLGPFPLETLVRDESVAEREAARPPVAAGAETAPEGPLTRAAAHYRELFVKFADGEPAPSQAPGAGRPRPPRGRHQGRGLFPRCRAGRHLPGAGECLARRRRPSRARLCRRHPGRAPAPAGTGQSGARVDCARPRRNRRHARGRNRGLRFRPHPRHGLCRPRAFCWQQSGRCRAAGGAGGLSRADRRSVAQSLCRRFLPRGGDHRLRARHRHPPARQRAQRARARLLAGPQRRAVGPRAQPAE